MEAKEIITELQSIAEWLDKEQFSMKKEIEYNDKISLFRRNHAELFQAALAELETHERALIRGFAGITSEPNEGK